MCKPPVGAAPSREEPTSASELRRRGCYGSGEAADPELPPVSTLDRSKAMRRASSYSGSTSSSERLPELDIAPDSIGIGEGRGEDGAREESE